MVGEIMYDGYFKEIRAFRVYVLEASRGKIAVCEEELLALLELPLRLLGLVLQYCYIFCRIGLGI